MQFKVVLVPFPFDDLSGQKVRPAVCLTGAVGAHRHVVLAFITSTVPATLEPTDILLQPGTPDFVPTGLRVPSTLRLHRMPARRACTNVSVARALDSPPASYGNGIGRNYPTAAGRAHAGIAGEGSAATADAIWAVIPVTPRFYTLRQSASVDLFEEPTLTD